MSLQYYEGVGRRKESVARVRVMHGTGKFLVNEKEASAYFTRLGDLERIMSVFQAVGQEPGAYDVSVLVKGGGVTGQADSVRLGLARAFLKMNPDWRAALRQYDLLTRDAREKERKKPGLKRARKAPTYTKR